ncbi:MAG: outer membrane lipoprotein chaperone LolA [Bordetella sp.]|nr:MAG: outer membrane lipoprotein chaperone LolA [Bordetella sp.]
MFRKILFLIFLIIFLVFSKESNASNELTQFEIFTTKIKNLQGSFIQKIIESDNTNQMEQKGKFSFQRPGKFKWVIQYPYEQLIISNGESIFQYDPDLDQVSIQNLNEVLINAPATALFISNNIETLLDVRLLFQKNKIDHLQVKPKIENVGFKHMFIGLKNNMPLYLEFVDIFEKKIRIEFLNVSEIADFSVNEFDFTIPDNANIIHM